MPPTCTICRHRERDAIESALVAGEPLRNIAKRHGTSPATLIRHRENCTGATLAAAQQAAEVARGDDLLSQVLDLQARTLGILQRAEEAGDGRLALGAIREARGNLDLLGRLAGELQAAGTVNILVSPQWQDIRGVILAALAPHPTARLAVAQALLGAGDAS